MTRDSNPSDTTTLTPLAAAAHAGCGRTTIMKAIKSHDLKATRDNRNRWKIRLQDLERWIKDHPVSDATLTVTAASLTLDSRAGEADTAVKLAAAEEKILGLEARLSDTQADRDAWRAQAELLATRPERSFWGRIWNSRQ